MAECPLCKTPGAYVGFNSVECRNPDCEHFVLFEEEICPCCGQPGHTPEKHAAAMRQKTSGQQDAAQQDPTLDPSVSGNTSD